MPRRAQLLLGLVVLAAHLVLLAWWGLGQHQGVLSAMAEPEFNRALLPTADADVSATQQQAALAATLAHPPPTVGQVVQARTVWAGQAPRDPPPTAAPAPTRTAPTQPPTRPPKRLPATPAPDAQAPALAATEAPQPTPADPEPSTPVTPPPPVALATDTAPPVPTAPSAEKHESNKPPTLINDAFTAINVGNDASAWLNAWPLSTRLSYKLEGHYRGPLYGQAQVQWVRTDERYQAHILVNVGLFLDMRLTSQGRITPTHLWPQVYEEDRRGKKRGARLGEQTVVLDNGLTVPRPPRLQDTTSQFVQLAQDFASGRVPLRVGAVVPVTLARPGGVDEWTYDVVALDTLATPLGPLAAYHLKPRALTSARSGVSAEMWFAPSLQHLPARIRLSLNADTWLDLTLEKVAQSP